ncbi:MAG: thioredoxin domain-containing protein [Acidobacteria bacterium]|nr:thioredoxin domain-containing protein [Acidobacteriota bacterium]
MPNRLQHEPSPYLRQHADNPVDWYPWGEEAFAAARRDDRPIFLSIGYSTCHWCHVMEHESFEDAGIARLLKEHFVSVKVDREERPDVDRVYMAFVQATTGSGGWPMSVWLTPDLKPFLGGTYFPPSGRGGRPGFEDVLREIARRWSTGREALVRSASTIVDRLREMQQRSAKVAADGVAGADALADGVQQFVEAFDERHGGFGGAPKFPRPSELLFLLREGARGPNPEARRMAVATLEAIARGGVRDHVGGGFHRYSVDAAWRVPHFEKMLYDQAQLVLACLEAQQATGQRVFGDVAEDTLAYVLRDMTDEAGGFYSAEDADSLPPEADAAGPAALKAEGAFYLWTDAEVRALLGGDADIVTRRLGIEPNGNAPADPLGEFRGKNIPYLGQDVRDIAALTGRTPADVERVCDEARDRLFETRARRPRPHLDDKVLAAWNGMMIAACARAGRVLEPPSSARWLGAAARAAAFARERLWDPERRILHRRSRAGQVSIDGYAEDYACLVWGLLELFQAEGGVEWLDWAQELAARQDELFWDEGEGGWFATTGDDPSVLLRMKEDYDGAEPSAGAVAADNALTLARITGDSAAAARAERTLARFGVRPGQAARVVPMMMAVLARYHAPPTQVVLVGSPDDEGYRALARTVAARYLPFAVRIPVEPGPRQEELAARLPFVGAMTLVGGRSTAYVCDDFTCREPVTTPAALDAQLASIEQHP